MPESVMNTEDFIPKTREDVTLDWLNSVLHVNGLHAVSFEWETGEVHDGIGALSELERLILATRTWNPVTFTTTSSDALQEVRLIMKSLPSDLQVRSFLTSTGMWIKEVKMYTQILPAFDQLLDSKGVSKKKRFNYPKCYYGAAKSADKPEDYRCLLLLEDFASSGYVHWRGMKPEYHASMQHFDWSHTSQILQQLGYFHAAAAIYRKIHGFQSFNTQFDLTMPPFDNPGVDYIINLGFDATRPILETSESLPDGLLKAFDTLKGSYKTWAVPYFLEIREDEFRVLRHNDLHVFNIVCKYDSQGSCVDTKYYDFQNVFEGDPALDVAYFLLLNADPSYSSTELKTSLLVYYNAFSSVYQEAGIELDYKFENLEHDFEKCRLFAILFLISGARMWCNGSYTNESLKSRVREAIVYGYKSGAFSVVE